MHYYYYSLLLFCLSCCFLESHLLNIPQLATGFTPALGPEHEAQVEVHSTVRLYSSLALPLAPLQALHLSPSDLRPGRFPEDRAESDLTH